MDFAGLPPLIVTLKLDDESFAFFDELRRLNFPPERNFLSAHLTLFHHLPGAELQKVVSDLEYLCGGFQNFPLEFPGWRMLGRGVAIKVEASGLYSLHHHLSKMWSDWLTAQDRQKFQPHITVQNKVSPDEAKMLYKNLVADWQPRTGNATGVRLWHYLGGEWQSERDFAFAKDVKSA